MNASQSRGPESAWLRPPAETDRAAHVASRATIPRLWPWIVGATALAAASIAALLLEHFAHAPTAE